MIRYLPAINVPGTKRAFVHDECEELSDDSGREDGGRGVGDGESMVAPMSAVMLAANPSSGFPHNAQNGVLWLESFPHDLHLGIAYPPPTVSYKTLRLHQNRCTLTSYSPINLLYRSHQQILLAPPQTPLLR